jgi:hypothetical protein
MDERWRDIGSTTLVSPRPGESHRVAQKNSLSAVIDDLSVND